MIKVKIRSASDNTQYPEFCLLAAQNDAVFSTFRQNEIYQKILEHFNYKDGEIYLNQILEENPSLISYFDTFKTNDDFGGAQCLAYPGIGKISPSTLHYIRQLSYLEVYFGSLAHMEIVEIGGGYGGLAKIIMDRFDIKSYTIYDLPEVNELTRRYLVNFGEKYLAKLNFGNFDNSSKKAYDLCISNCAFTECTPVIQDLYLEKVIKFCKKGFMLYNFRVESYHPVVLLTKLETCGLDKLGANKVKDTHARVFILAWNTRKKLGLLPYKRRVVYKFSPNLYYEGLRFFRFIKKLNFAKG